jgi:protein TonB
MSTIFKTIDPCCLDLDLPLAGSGGSGRVRTSDEASGPARRWALLPVVLAAALHGCVFALLAALGMGAAVQHGVISVSLLPAGLSSSPVTAHASGESAGGVEVARAAPLASQPGPAASVTRRADVGLEGPAKKRPPAAAQQDRPVRPDRQSVPSKTRIAAQDAPPAFRGQAVSSMPPASTAEAEGEPAPARDGVLNSTSAAAAAGRGGDVFGGGWGNAHAPAAGGGGAPPGSAAFGDSAGPPFLRRGLPQYPEIARRRGREGRVVLRLVIGAGGELKDAAVVEGGGHGFEEAALKAARASVYAPALRGGRPVECAAMLPVRFSLEGS